MANIVELYFRKVASVDEVKELMQRPNCRLFGRRGIGLHKAKVIFPIVWDPELGGFDVRDNTATKLKQLKTIEDLVAFYRKVTDEDRHVTISFSGKDETFLLVNSADAFDISWSKP